jgi:hypothetical protein
MRAVTGSASTPDPDAAPHDPGEQRLARPPSARYGSSPVAGTPAQPSPSTSRASAARGIAFGAVAAILGGAVIVLLGGAMAVSAGLLVAAAAIGYAVGEAMVAGAGDTLPRTARPWIAATLAGLGALLGQVGLWLFARSEGGVLPLIDYLGQTFGPLVPLELLLAAGVAWWRAR